MSSIRSNSIGDADFDDFQFTDHQQQILDTLLSVPIKPPELQTTYSVMTPKGQLEQNTRKKLLLFIKCLLLNVQYKNQIKTLSINLSLLDKMKSANGMTSSQKDILKFTIFLKHHDIEESKQYFANLICKVLIGGK